MEERKEREREFHDHLRANLLPTGDHKYTAYRKWYSAGSRAQDWMVTQIRRYGANKRILDYACGDGDLTIQLADITDNIVGIDISGEGIKLAKQKAVDQGISVDFKVMDAENTNFEPNTFDVIVCSGVLHHMELITSYPEIARILKPDGTVIVLEAWDGNPLIRWYRNRTPYLRSPDEHPLRSEDLALASRYFDDIQLRYFNLATLAAAPLWKTPFVKPAAALLSLIDAVVLRLPLIQRYAWMVGMILRAPKER